MSMPESSIGWCLLNPDKRDEEVNTVYEKKRKTVLLV
jgi:hypothetical protein